MKTTNKHPHEARLLTFHEVEKITGLSRHDVYVGIRRGDFPEPCVILEERVGFLPSEIERWVMQRQAC